MPGRLLTAAIIMSSGAAVTITAAAVLFIKDKIYSLLKEKKRKAAYTKTDFDVQAETVLLREEEV